MPFGHIEINIIGFLEKNTRGHQFTPLVVSYIICYPDDTGCPDHSQRTLQRTSLEICYPMKISLMGLTCVLSNTTSLGSHSNLSIWTSLYCPLPHTYGVLKRFKKISQKACCETLWSEYKRWRKAHFILFTIWKVPQMSTAFLPFELLYWLYPWEIQYLVKEAWREQPMFFGYTEIQYCSGN